MARGKERKGDEAELWHLLPTNTHTHTERSQVGRVASALVESLNLPQWQAAEEEEEKEKEKEEKDKEEQASRTRCQLDAEMYLFQPDDFKKR